jgi:hypothetical protein
MEVTYDLNAIITVDTDTTGKQSVH